MNATLDFLAVFVPVAIGLAIVGAIVIGFVARRNQARRVKAHFKAKQTSGKTPA